ncbi:MAG: DUF559 domain-containing protein [Gordonibacter sp.]|nr:DUF559 domain-containing protein [Gordonibacter sp.]
MGGVPLFFSHTTALRILRTAYLEKSDVVRSGILTLPDQAPGRSDYLESLRRLRLLHPGIKIDEPAHVLVKNDSRRRLSSYCKEHVCSAPLSGAIFYRLSENAYVSIPALAFVNLASTLNHLSLLEFAYELCGTYQTYRTGVESAYNVIPLTSVREISAFVGRNPSLKGSKKVQRALRYVSDKSASVRETKLALMLGLPCLYGGFGLGMPYMNFKVQANARARAITGKSSFRCDLCWPEAKLDVEYQSRYAHEGEARRIEDSRRTNALIAMGWRVVGITNKEIESSEALETIAATIRRYLERSIYARMADYPARRVNLRRQLGLPINE